MPGNSEMVARYKAAHPDSPNPPNNEQVGLGYAAGLVIRQALETAASRDSEKLRAVMASAEFDNLPLPGKKAAFDETGLNKFAALILTEWNEANAHTVWPLDMRAMKPVI